MHWPGVPGRLHCSHTPSQAVPQQTPSVQKFMAQSLLALHAAPTALPLGLTIAPSPPPRSHRERCCARAVEVTEEARAARNGQHHDKDRQRSKDAAKWGDEALQPRHLHIRTSSSRLTEQVRLGLHRISAHALNVRAHPDRYGLDHFMLRWRLDVPDVEHVGVEGREFRPGVAGRGASKCSTGSEADVATDPGHVFLPDHSRWAGSGRSSRWFFDLSPCRADDQVVDVVRGQNGPQVSPRRMCSTIARSEMWPSSWTIGWFKVYVAKPAMAHPVDAGALHPRREVEAHREQAVVLDGPSGRARRSTGLLLRPTRLSRWRRRSSPPCATSERQSPSARSPCRRTSASRHQPRRERAGAPAEEHPPVERIHAEEDIAEKAARARPPTKEGLRGDRRPPASAPSQEDDESHRPLDERAPAVLPYPVPERGHAEQLMSTPKRVTSRSAHRRSTPA